MKVTIQNNRGIIDHILVYGAYLSDKNNNNLQFHDIQKIRDGTTKFRFKLEIGVTEILYKTIPIIITYHVTDAIVGTTVNAKKFHSITLESNRTTDFFADFLENARDFYKEKKEVDEVLTYIYRNGFWNILSKLSKRELSTIHLPKGCLGKLVDDFSIFFESEKKYVQYGIPYKRNYLFEGIPGTGKTSLIFALASHFDYNIAIMNFDLSIDDVTFMKAVSKLPDDCFLILEDIDALFVERKAGDSNKSMVSFSGILNTLDGMARKKKQITFLTTNYLIKLDKALIRPGRIDKIIKFSYSTIEQIKSMYDKFLSKQGHNWKTFKKKIRGTKTTSALLQSFFFKYHECDNILEHVDEFKEMVCENVQNKFDHTFLYS